jgi:thiamine biosynthesis lipoprotein
MQLDLGGIAQGYVAQAVINFLTRNGIQSVLTNASGDIVCTAPPPGKKGWTVGINRPGSTTDLLPETIEIAHCAITTSGDLYQYIEHEGKRYSHIVDPRTGYGIQTQRNVTVITANGTAADWLATACCILPLRQSKKLARKTGSRLLITELKNGTVAYAMNRGMKKLLKN